MPDVSRSSLPHQAPLGRRAAPRVHAAGHVLARILTLNVPVEMRDISLSGFQLVSDVPVGVGETHETRAVTVTGLVCTFRARVVRCEPRTSGEAGYTTGWEVSPDRDSTVAIGAVVDTLTATPIFPIGTGADA